MDTYSEAQQTCLLPLERAGLIVSPFGSIGPYAYGYSIGKPVSTQGNSRPYDNPLPVFGSNAIPINAPVAHLYPQQQVWIFEIWEFLPGPGPGDFQRSFNSLDMAVRAVLEYYFGDPSDMNPPDFIKL